MMKWEYKEVRWAKGDINIYELNQLGAKGWEMIGIVNLGNGSMAGHMIFKRQVA